MMSEDTLVNTLYFLSSVHDAPADKMLFHSVEPTLRGLPFFIRAEEVIEEFGISVDRLLATNTTSDVWCNNIDDWCKFLSDNNWTMNISLDGTEHIHDRNRGAGNWRKVIESLIHIKEHDISYGIISVVVDGEDLNPVYDFFVDIGNSLQLNPVMPINDMAAELCDLFDRWMLDGRPIPINPFDDVLKYINDEFYTRSCPGSCGYNFVSIIPNGDVLPCGVFWDNTDIADLYVYGNVNTDSFDDIWYGAERQKMLDYVDNVPDECNACRWIDFCGTGCSHAKHAGADKCGYMKTLLEHVARKCDKI